MRWTGLAEGAFRFVSWFYRALFVGLGILFLYWSGRGVVAYAGGNREAWADPVAGVAGLIAAVLSFWVSSKMLRKGMLQIRISRSSVNPELDAVLEEATRLERTDPDAATKLLDGYFMREAERTTLRREELRRRAPNDLKAARALREELQAELAGNADFRKEVAKEAPEHGHAGMLSEIDASDRQVQSELVRLDALIEQLRQE